MSACCSPAQRRLYGTAFAASTRRKLDSNMIEVGDQDGVTILRMAHGKANAMSIDFCELLTARLEKLNASPTSAIIITGNGRIFSAGVDLLLLLDGGVPYIRKFLPALSAMLATVFSYP